MATIKDVAREAGVSLGTASQALRGQPSVRETTRRRVLAVATRLRYQPSALARGLVTRRTHTVGLLISDIANPFFIRAVRAVEDVVEESGYNVILCNTDEDSAKETQYLRVLTEKRVDGIILATTAGSLQAVRDVRWRRIPDNLSLVGYDDMEWWTLTHPPLTTVGQPVYELGREAMRLLLAQIGREKARRPQPVVLKPGLILRESCGPPPRRVRPPHRLEGHAAPRW